MFTLKPLSFMGALTITAVYWQLSSSSYSAITNRFTYVFAFINYNNLAHFASSGKKHYTASLIISFANASSSAFRLS